MKRDVYDAGQFEYRVQYAAQEIVRCDGVPQSRHFDTCFEMGDGDGVVEALVRRAERRPDGALARKLYGAISRERAMDIHAELKDVPRNLLCKAGYREYV